MTRMKRSLGRLAVVAAVVLVLSGLAADVTLARRPGQTGNTNTQPTSQTGGN